MLITRSQSDLKLKFAFVELRFRAIGSPAYENVPAFQWSKSALEKTIKHVGHPDLWRFAAGLFFVGFLPCLSAHLDTHRLVEHKWETPNVRANL